MAIDRNDFATSCVLDGIYVGVNAHYLAAAAQNRSGIKDDKGDGLIGPFQLTKDQWNANRSDAEFEIDISEQKMDRWEYHTTVFALMTYRALQGLGPSPSALDLYIAQFPTTDRVKLEADLKAAFAATKAEIRAAWKRVTEGNTPAGSLVGDPSASAAAASATLNLGSIASARRPVAQLIAARFASAGFGALQQIAAVANAKAESALIPTAHAGGGEDSWGLFQLNRKGGLGQGHTPDELKDPETNIRITIQEARKVKEFVDAGSIEAAVSAFVRRVERPRDARGQILARVAIAQQLMA